MIENVSGIRRLYPKVNIICQKKKNTGTEILLAGIYLLVNKIGYLMIIIKAK